MVIGKAVAPLAHGLKILKREIRRLQVLQLEPGARQFGVILRPQFRLKPHAETQVAAKLIFSDFSLPPLQTPSKRIATFVSTSLTHRDKLVPVGTDNLTLSVCFPLLFRCSPPGHQLFTMSSTNGLKREAAPFDTPPSGNSGGKPTKIRRALAACKNCRKQKTRCDHTGGAPCHRCKVLG